MKKEKKFKLFDMNRDGKGVEKDEVVGPPNLKNFFKSFFRKFNKLLSLNLMLWAKLPMYFLVLLLMSYLLCNQGGIFAIVFTTVASLLGNPIYIVSSPIFSTISGTYIASGAFLGETFSPSAAVNNMAIYGNVIEEPGISIKFLVVIGILLLFALITWGWQCVGSAYISRGLVRGDPVFLFTDYFHAVKKNLKQGFLLGLIDAIIILVLTFDICYLYENSVDFMSEMILFIIGGSIILYSIMRKYIYLLLITFDIKISKIFKNALIFSVLGLKRNLLGSLGSALLLILNIILGVLCLNFNFIVPLILPVVYYFGTSIYISAYSAYPVIDKYMIEPYKKAHSQEEVAEG